ncbi:glycosyltransferase family 87 protein [Streptomyces sp. Y2F8-2]|uniref:glycosyltransferase family 87 protein n=1 Tax=Streptomyces sp. Y2F8-2 TaxID=2759675 RepID=UPI001906E3FA|nr:glycosyltransferase family 87 protein [Streptomyces sp. Y2F8-2]
MSALKTALERPATRPAPFFPPPFWKRVRRTHRLLLLAVGWLATRALMLWLLAHDQYRLLGRGGVAMEVWKLYFHWYGTLRHGAFPSGDHLWQYPPGAGAVLLSPALLPGLTYFQAFVVITLFTDAVITLVLAYAGTRRGRSLRGAALWITGLPLLLHIPLARYDIQVTAFAVVALLTSGRSARLGGAFAALGALVKVWPALALIGTPRNRGTRQAWTTAAVTVVTLLAVVAVLFRNPFDFLRQQGGRGVQIESLGGTVLMLARRAGWSGTTRYQYGAVEFVGPHVRAVADCSLALTAVAFALLLLWRLRTRRWTPATPYDAALTAVLLFTVTSRVISPQYMIWLVGLAAVCLTTRHTTQRPVARLILAATAISAVVYPAFYGEVIRSTWWGCLLMLTRNGLLTTAAAMSFVRLWRSGRAVPQRESADAPAGKDRVPALSPTGR